MIPYNLPTQDTPTPSGALSANEVLRLVFEQVDAGVDVMTIQGIVTMVLRSFALQNDFKNAYRLFSTQVCAHALLCI